MNLFYFYFYFIQPIKLYLLPDFVFVSQAEKMPDGRMIVHNYGHCGYGIMSSPGTSFQVLMWTQNHYLALPFRCSCERIITWHILSGIVKNHYLNLPFRYCCKRIIVWLFLSSIAVNKIIILIFLSGIVVKEIIIFIIFQVLSWKKSLSWPFFQV